MTKSIVRNIITLVFLVIIFFLFYDFFIAEDAKVPLLSTESQEAEQETLIRELIGLQDDLRGVALNTQFLESSIFESLKDFSVSLPVRPEGRANPFGPL